MAQISNIPALIQIMAWRRPGDKPLSEPMMVRLPTHICVTRPQWVNHCFIHRAWLGHQNLKLCWKFPLFSADWPNFPNPTMHLSLSHHAPFRTEMCSFLFWIVHCGIWDRCIVRFVRHGLLRQRQLDCFTEPWCDLSTGIRVGSTNNAIVIWPPIPWVIWHLQGTGGLRRSCNKTISVVH